ADSRFADRGPWLSGVVVVGRARNLGVGRGMLDAAADRARQVGATELWLHTAAAARFYERCGYELAHVKQGHEDDAVLWLALWPVPRRAGSGFVSQASSAARMRAAASAAS